MTMMQMSRTSPFNDPNTDLTETVQLNMNDECVKTTLVSEGVTTKLWVRGFASLDDLWSVFPCYGQVSSIITDQNGATVTYHDQSIFPELEFNVDMELVGEQTMIFCKLSQASDTTEMTGYGSEYAPVFNPHHPPPLSPHYDTAILGVGGQSQSQFGLYPYPVSGQQQFTVPPPPIPGANVFTFDQHQVTEANVVTKKADHGCYVCSGQDSQQPLTPITPTYPYPPPSIYLPHHPLQSASSTTLMSLSGTSLVSNDSTSYVVPIGTDRGQPEETKQAPAMTGYQYFTSPYKRFSKFQGVPTPAKFPLVINNGQVSQEHEETGDKRRWYQAGDRWGHRRQQARSFSQSDIGETSIKAISEASLEGISNLSLK